MLPFLEFFSPSPIPQLPSTKNNPYAKVEYLGVAYSVPLQLFLCVFPPACATRAEI